MVRLLWVKGLISLNPSQVSARSLKDAKAGSVHIQMVQNILKPLQVILRSLHTKAFHPILPDTAFYYFSLTLYFPKSRESRSSTPDPKSTPHHALITEPPCRMPM